MKKLYLGCLVLLSVLAVHANAKVYDKNYDELIGVWQFTIASDMYEIAMWPIENLGSLNGSMAIGGVVLDKNECRSVHQTILAEDTNSEDFRNFVLKLPNGETIKNFTAYGFSYNALEVDIFRKRQACEFDYKGAYFVKNNDDGKFYVSLWKYLLVGNEYQVRYEKLIPFKKVVPSSAMRSVLNELRAGGRPHAQEVSKVYDILLDPKKGFSTQAEMAKGRAEFEKEQGQFIPEAVVTKPAGYWWNNYRLDRYLTRIGRESSMTYWDDKLPTHLQGVFDGDRSNLKIDTDFYDFFISFLRAYEGTCSDQLAKDSLIANMTITKTETNGFGATIRSSEKETAPIRMRSKMYEAWNEGFRKSLYGERDSSTQNRLSELLQREGCASDTVEQILENYRRIILNKQTIQQYIKLKSYRAVRLPQNYWESNYSYSAYAQRHGIGQSNPISDDKMPYYLQIVFDGEKHGEWATVQYWNLYASLFYANSTMCLADKVVDQKHYQQVLFNSQNKNIVINKEYEYIHGLIQKRIRELKLDILNNPVFPRAVDIVNKEGCGSAVINQLIYNFDSIRTGRKTIQTLEAEY